MHIIQIPPVGSEAAHWHGMTPIRAFGSTIFQVFIVDVCVGVIAVKIGLIATEEYRQTRSLKTNWLHKASPLGLRGRTYIPIGCKFPYFRLASVSF